MKVAESLASGLVSPRQSQIKSQAQQIKQMKCNPHPIYNSTPGLAHCIQGQIPHPVPASPPMLQSNTGSHKKRTKTNYLIIHQYHCCFCCWCWGPNPGSPTCQISSVPLRCICSSPWAPNIMNTSDSISQELAITVNPFSGTISFFFFTRSFIYEKKTQAHALEFPI